MTAADPPRFTLPSVTVGHAWSPVWCATSDDKERHVLYRTVLLEWFDRRGIRLVCTDSYALLTSWLGVTEHEPEPPIDLAPDHETIVSDTDKRGLGLINYAQACAAKDKDVDGTYHRTTLAVGPPSSSRKTPALAESLEQDVLRISYEGETVELPIVEAAYPSWRPFVAGRAAEPTDHIALSPHVLGILAKTGREYAWTLHGELGSIHIASIAGLPIRGAVMPIRTDAGIDEEAA